MWWTAPAAGSRHREHQAADQTQQKEREPDRKPPGQIDAVLGWRREVEERGEYRAEEDSGGDVRGLVEQDAAGGEREDAGQPARPQGPRGLLRSLGCAHRLSELVYRRDRPCP